MQRKGIQGIALCFLIIASSFVLAQPSLDVGESVLQISLSPNTEKTATFTIQNTGSTPLAIAFDTSQLDLTDSQGEKITVSFSPTAPQVNPGDNVLITMTLQPDPQISFERFGGTLVVKDTTAGSTAQDTLQITIDVEPDVCDFGQVGSDLTIDIKEPDSSDEFKPGDTIPIEVDVNNEGQNDVRVQVEAFLFNENQNIADTSSATKRIEESSDESFTLNLLLPLDTENIDEDDELTLIIKAFDDEDEQLNCVQAEQNVKIELDNDDIVIDEQESQLFPNTAACGDTVAASVKVINIGSDDNENVVLSVQNRELGINERSDSFTLESFNSEEENTAIRHFQLKVPPAARQKTYNLDIKVDFDGGSDTRTLPLEVTSCQEGGFMPGTEAAVTLKSLEGTVTATRGKIVSIPVEITNNQARKVIYIVSAANIEDFGDASTKTITLNPRAKTTTFMDIIVREGALQGIYGATIIVKEGAKVVASTDVAVTIDGKGTTKTTAAQTPLVGSISTPVWIIVNLVILALVIFSARFILILWKKQKNTKEEE